MMLAKLADDLMLRRKVMEKESTTLEDQDAMTVSRVNEDNNNKVKIIMDVELDGQETKQFSMEVDPLRRTKKAMKAVASRLGKEVSSLKFLVERENGKWRRLGEEEIVRDLKGTISFINIHQFQSIWYFSSSISKNSVPFSSSISINLPGSPNVTVAVRDSQ